MFEEVDELKRRLDAHRPFPTEVERRVERVLRPLFIFHSNALEGNRLSLGDTIDLLERGRLPSGAREDDYLELKGQRSAYGYLHQLVAGQTQISEKVARELHQLVTQDLDPAKYAPGRYKSRDNRVQLADGTVFPYLSHVETPAAMAALVDWFRVRRTEGVHPVQLAAELHFRFILIHPFLDGNGRTARLLANHVLLSAGHAPGFSRPEERRTAYRAALGAVDASVPLADLRWDHAELNMFPFVAYVEADVLWTSREVLEVVEGRAAVEGEDLRARFASLEKRLQAPQALDIAERRRRLDDLVTELGNLVASQLRDVANELNATSGALAITVAVEWRPKGLDRGRAAHELRDGDGPVHGLVARVTAAVTNGPGGASTEVPENLLEIWVASDPGGIVLGALTYVGAGHYTPYPDLPMLSARLVMPTDRLRWRESEWRPFCVARVAGLLDELNEREGVP